MHILLLNQLTTPIFFTPLRSLLSPALSGFLWLLVLLIFSFVVVHLLKLAFLGWEYRESKKENPEKEPLSSEEDTTKNKAPAQSPQEPIYYIVEKKTKRAKASYSEPKQIRFK